ncbi:MAG: LuxR C-terminal-related transcriptional regulator [Nostochopsis sp.]
MIRVLIADKYSLVRAGIRATLTAEKELTLVGEAINENETQQLSQKLKPDVLLLGSNITCYTLTETLTYLRTYCSDVKVLILTLGDEVYWHNLVTDSVAGCVFKDEEAETLVSAIRTVAQGHSWFSQLFIKKLTQYKKDTQTQIQETTLTKRERQVLEKIAQGWDNFRIAADLCLAEQTVRNYVSRIYEKIAVNSRSEAVVWAMNNSLVKQRKQVR